jgi:hypothetical protein
MHVVPLFENVLSYRLDCRLPVFMTKEETFQNEDSNIGLYKKESIETSRVVITHPNSIVLVSL